MAGIPGNSLLIKSLRLLYGTLAVISIGFTLGAACLLIWNHQRERIETRRVRAPGGMLDAVVSTVPYNAITSTTHEVRIQNVKTQDSELVLRATSLAAIEVSWLAKDRLGIHLTGSGDIHYFRSDVPYPGVDMIESLREAISIDLNYKAKQRRKSWGRDM